MKLKPESEKKIEEMVASGNFKDADAVIDYFYQMNNWPNVWIKRNKERLEDEMEKGLNSLLRPMTAFAWEKINAIANGHKKSTTGN